MIVPLQPGLNSIPQPLLDSLSSLAEDALVLEVGCEVLPALAEAGHCLPDYCLALRPEWTLLDEGAATVPETITLFEGSPLDLVAELDPDTPVSCCIWTALEGYRKLYLGMSGLMPYLAVLGQIFVATKDSALMRQVVADLQVLYPELTLQAELPNWLWLIRNNTVIPTQMFVSPVALVLGTACRQAEWETETANVQSGDHWEYFELGLRLQEQQRYSEALLAYDQHLTRDPHHAASLNNCGNIFRDLKQYEASLACYDRALQGLEAPTHLFINKALTLAELNKVKEALAILNQISSEDAEYVQALIIRGNLLQQSNHLDEALQTYQRVVNLNPSCQLLAVALHQLGLTQHELGNFQEQEQAHQAALACNPNFLSARIALDMLRLLQGDSPAEWENYERRFEDCREFRKIHAQYTQPLWQGKDLAESTLLVWGEQGFGDHLQFCRYLSYLRQRYPHCRLLFRTEPQLYRLMQQLEPLDIHIYSTSDSLPNHDWQVPLLSLPHRLQTRIETIPPISPLFEVVHKRTLPGVTSNFNVGIIWRSGRRTDPNLYAIYRKKSIPLSLMLDVVHLNDVNLYSLQVDEDASEIEMYLDGKQIFSLSSEIHDFQDTADWIGALDLIVTVDTAAAHLAGAMGKPVWLLLPAVPDWRWGLESQVTPWYPTMRLYRQQKRGNWSAPLEQVRHDFSQITASAPLSV